MFFQSPPPPPPRPIPITIFVHGTQFHTLIKDVDLRSTFKPDTQTPSGLHQLSSLKKEHKTTIFLSKLAQQDPINFSFDGIYAFGWSGKNTVTERKQASKQLFLLIKSLTQAYKNQHKSVPDITVITHSHGGNVLLHMADYWDHSFFIKQAILLGCPVQKETAHQSAHEMFKTMYSFYSCDEWAQIIDPQLAQPLRSIFENWQNGSGINLQKIKAAVDLSKKMPLCSDRHFPSHPHLIQAEICWKSKPAFNKKSIKNPALLAEHLIYDLTHPVHLFFSHQSRGLFHTEFTTDLFMQHLPSLIAQAQKQVMNNAPSSTNIKLFITSS